MSDVMLRAAARVAMALALVCTGLHVVMALSMPGFVSALLLAVTLICLGCVVGLRRHAGPRPWIAMAGLSGIALVLHALMSLPAADGSLLLQGHAHGVGQGARSASAGTADWVAVPLMTISSTMAIAEIAVCLGVASIVRHRMRRADARSRPHAEHVMTPEGAIAHAAL